MVTDWTDLRGEDYLDTRTVIEQRDALLLDIEIDEREPDEEEQVFLDEVKNLSNEISEFEDGNMLVLEDSFEDYARQLAEDIGAITGSESWPCNCIDWERAANELRHDYSGVAFMGNDYLVRS
jgi:hypothetical protein